MVGRGARRSVTQRWLGLVLACVIGAQFSLGGQSLAIAQSEPASEATVEFVHAAPSVGAVDVYLDGSLALLGIRFGDAAVPITRAVGEHDVDIVPAGRALADAVAAERLGLDAGASEMALVGGAESLAIVAWPLDLSPVPPTISRLRFVNGAAAFGAADLALTGGDLLFPSVANGEATEAADLQAGGYDLEIRYGGTDTVALSLPGFTLEPGLVYSLYLAGDANVGDVQTMITARSAAVPVVEGVAGDIRRGNCGGAAAADVVADLTTVSVSPFGEDVGFPESPLTAASYTSVAIPFTELVATTHSIVLLSAGESEPVVVGCGEIGGRPTLDGSLVVSVGSTGTDSVLGIAVLAPNILDASLTDLSVFITLPPNPGSEAPAIEVLPAATPVAAP